MGGTAVSSRGVSGDPGNFLDSTDALFGEGYSSTLLSVVSAVIVACALLAFDSLLEFVVLPLSRALGIGTFPDAIRLAILSRLDGDVAKGIVSFAPSGRFDSSISTRMSSSEPDLHVSPFDASSAISDDKIGRGGGGGGGEVGKALDSVAVSYTHLTLPTN